MKKEKEEKEKDVFAYLQEYRKKRKKSILYALGSFVGILIMSMGCLTLPDIKGLTLTGTGLLVALSGIVLELKLNKLF